MKTPRATKTDRDPNLVVLYVRVSTEDQAASNLSIPAQREALRRHCAERKLTIAAEHVEPGASARDDARPIFRQMIAEVIAGGSRVGAILVLHTSRFMRNALAARNYKQQLRRRGVSVISIQQETADDPTGHLMENLFESFDQYESEINGIRTASAMRENARQGFFNGSTPPFGFAVERVRVGAERTKGRLVPCAEEVSILREVFRLYAAGAGAKRVARELNQRGLRHRGRLWTLNLVLKVLEDEAAIGTAYWGKKEGRTGVPKPREEWVATRVESIIDRDLFALAARVRDAHDPKTHPGRTSSSPLLLAGLAVCGRCGAPYQIETSGKRDARGEYSHRYYNCRAFLRTGREACAGSRIRVARLDAAVLGFLANELFTEERCRQILKDVVEETGVLRRKTDEQRREIERELADIDRRIRKWEDAFEQDAQVADVAVPRLRTLRAERDELARTLAKVVPLHAPPPHLYTDANIRRFQASLREIFLASDQTMAKNYLRMLVDAIMITDGVVEVRGRSVAAAAMMADSGASSDGIRQPEQVLATVNGWRATEDSNL